MWLALAWRGWRCVVAHVAAALSAIPCKRSITNSLWVEQSIVWVFTESWSVEFFPMFLELSA
jgi:hypothetical protein